MPSLSTHFRAVLTDGVIVGKMTVVSQKKTVRFDALVKSSGQP
jgi:hypothetical protein